ncbi:ABC-2 family transporter protein [Bifidobacterium hapali]|uniref:ABC-2 family transporter protein n=1 Tax=Bifidobacterium hapali TaxID=1630172 RepID=A0A261FXS5_9BIFI|nr:YhgE/Pip domain-containing protein [Bifidobacterium hapali]OZG63972.1 ABC-2 family transporter protein [Bifidobacterium hapali]
MSNVLKILRRDALRLLRVPTAWVIIIGITVIPALYAWFNIVGFWDPYSNTKGVQVAIANEDTGTDDALLGHLAIGDQLVDQLKANHDLGWQFVSKSEALSRVESGESYAAIVIPKTFSEDMAGVITDGKNRPTLEYYVNEKANAVAPKITDTGASTVDTQVNNAFVSTASTVISDVVNKAGDTVSARADEKTQAAIKQLNESKQTIAKSRKSISDLTAELNEIPNKTDKARDAVTQATLAAANAGSALNSAATLIADTQTTANNVIASSGTAIDQGSNLLSQASAKANSGIATITGGMTSANAAVGDALTVAKQANDTTAELIAQLKSLPSTDVTASLISKLEARNTALGDSINRLTALNTDTGSLITGTQQSADAMNTATQTTISQLGTARTNLNATAIPQLNSGLTSVSGTARTLSDSLSDQTTLATQTRDVLDQLDQAANSTVQALKQTDNGLARIDAKLTTTATDLTTLASTNALNSLFGTDGKLNVSAISEFMLSPTVLDTKTVYPVATYGSGMAPLFTNMALWVGAFALMVIVRLEVDDEGLDDAPTAAERYVARFLLLAVPAAAQGIVTTIGDLVIGVQTVNVPLFVITGVITSLAYLSVMYMLSTTLMHVGKGLCVALIIVQIPGASGLYPIEMMPSFYRDLYPFFPFTYSIGAFRETIGGFYSNVWLRNVAMLFVFACVSFAIGIAVRPWLTNLNRLFARQLAEGDMFVGEQVQLPDRPFSMAQAIRMLADKDVYRTGVERRAAAFMAQYPRLKQGALVAGLAVPAVLAITLSLVAGANDAIGVKLAALATWIIWLLLIIGFLMTIELMRDSFERQTRLGTLGDDAIRAVLVAGRGGRRRRRHARDGRTAAAAQSAIQSAATPANTGISTAAVQTNPAQSHADITPIETATAAQATHVIAATPASAPQPTTQTADEAVTQQLPTVDLAIPPITPITIPTQSPHQPHQPQPTQPHQQEGRHAQ